ncbi:L,D-transpeptidase [Nakamurella silvestris]|nr:L,D-transpeptidase [Nakamurella silvestris]
MSFGVAHRTRRRFLAFTSLLVGLTLVASACSSTEPPFVVTVTNTAGAGDSGSTPVVVPTVGNGQTDGGDPAASNSVEPTAIVGRDVKITSTPASGSTKLAPTTAVTVTVFNAEIKDLVLVSKTDGTELTGKVAADGATWTLGEKMEYGTTYNYRGTAVSTDGVDTPIEGKISTANPKNTMRASFQIRNGKTVGVAAPIVLTFAGQITDQAEVQKNLKVMLNGKEFKGGSWAWLQDEDISGNGVLQSRVHFRPAKYWPANSKIKVTANLYGVDMGGAWGREDISTDFNIGRKLVVKADVNSFRLVVMVDDAIVKDFPVSYGAQDADPERATRNGVHIVQEKYESFDMCNPRFGYCDVKAPWAVRISNNGEFIHVNQNTERAGYLGKQNVSHGCINMGLADGKTFYDMTIYGDPVEITNSTGPQLGFSDGDIFDWGIPYSEWQNYSAL